MPGVFPDYPAPVVRNTDAGREMVTMRWGTKPPRVDGSLSKKLVSVERAARLVEEFLGRMVLWLIIKLRAYPLQPSL